MQLRAFFCALILLLSNIAISNASQVVEIQLGTGSVNKVTLIPKGIDSITVIVRHIPPKLMDQYSIDVSYQKDALAPFVRPSNPQTPAAVLGIVNPCTASAEQTFETNIQATKTPDEVVNLIIQANSNANITKACVTHIVNQTTKTMDVSLIAEYQATLAVSYIGTIQSTTIVKSPKQEWLTHVGFSFVSNRGTSYFSKPEQTEIINDQGVSSIETNYRITEQKNQDSWLYAASALFTYPMSSNENFNWGLTAGLSANSDTVAVLVGPSLIVQKNLLINFGVIFQEFDELSGTYEENQLITGDAIDSSVLSKQSFKPSVAITIGYNFGN